jgi:putative peptide zinc metalloprotease protein
MRLTSLPDKLPKLRSDVTIRRAEFDLNGMPTWVLYDLASHRFFHIGWQEYELLRYWHVASPKVLIETVTKETTLSPDEQDVMNLIAFLDKNCITQQGYDKLKKISDESESAQGSGLGKLLKGYLFFKIPLVKPDQWLKKTLPYVSWIFSKWLAYFMLLMGVVAGIQIIQQWDVFTHTLMDLNSLTVFFYLAVGIFITKIFHELGHAYMCKKHGATVPTMGVAFLVMWPVLYTDTSDSWRLSSNNARLKISLSGIWMELYLSVIAAWLWLLMGPGELRSVLFFIASTSWMISILINISPFMRFDGYYAFSDIWGVRNLQPRSFALAKWALRKVLFGLNLPVPESVHPRQRRLLITYALATWIYRFFLYIGIALLVYHFFFKLLGVILLLAEIYYLIILPIINEVKVWWHLRQHFSWNKNAIITTTCFAMLVFAFLVPWHTSIRLPATWVPHHQYYYAPESAQVDQVLVKQGEFVKKGQVLLRLHSGYLLFQRKIEEHKLTAAKNRLSHSLYNKVNRQNRLVIEEEIKQIQIKIQQTDRLLKKLVVKAKFNGYVADISDHLYHGLWVRSGGLLLVVVDPSSSWVDAYVKSRDIKRIELGRPGVFISDQLSVPEMPVSVISVGHKDIEFLDDQSLDKRTMLDDIEYVDSAAYHASLYGGLVRVHTKENKLVPEISLHRVRLSLTNPPILHQVQRGIVHLSVPGYAWIGQFWRFIVSGFIRESSF